MIWGKERRSSEKIDTLLAKDVVLRGDFEFSGGVQVDGTIHGCVKGTGAESVIRVTSQGEVLGDIHSPIVVINGKVTGNVYASVHLELGSQSHITGDVHYHVMEMLMGAEINGQMMHDSDGFAKEGSLMPVAVEDITVKKDRRQADDHQS